MLQLFVYIQTLFGANMSDNIHIMIKKLQFPYPSPDHILYDDTDDSKLLVGDWNLAPLIRKARAVNKTLHLLDVKCQVERRETVISCHWFCNNITIII